MSNGNFTNGSLVMRIWRMDGSSDLIAKFQYFGDAELFCEQMIARDADRGSNKDRAWFYLAVCDYECKSHAFNSPEQKAEGRSNG